jgi:GAF domain-containing protein
MTPLDSATASDLKAALASGSPALFAALSRLFTSVSGVRTATFIAVAPDRSVTHRIGTSNPVHFPVGNVDPVGDDPWNRSILGKMQPVIGNDVAQMGTFLPETSGLAAMGYNACACFPIVIAGETRGVVALLGDVGIFTASALAHIDTLLPLAALVFTFKGISSPPSKT